MRATTDSELAMLRAVDVRIPHLLPHYSTRHLLLPIRYTVRPSQEAHDCLQ